MSVSGVISRQILPACGNLCFCCPAMRPRSRQPVKRYKMLIADIFPKTQEEEPNDRKIAKLCEYAAKNPLRIPKIATSLEQRCYKELRSENFLAVKIIMCVYRKLLSSCRMQMPLFANSAMTIIQTLLDQTILDEMLIAGCQLVFDFVNNQNDATYMFSIEVFIPKLCQLAQEPGGEERALHLRAAGLQAVSAMIWFMGENSHISSEFDAIVSVVLENFQGPSKEEPSDPNQNRWVQEVQKTEGHIAPSPDAITKVPSWRMIVNDKGQLTVPIEDSKNPCFWSRVCLHNMGNLGNEATTMRRVLESLFRCFDNENLWPIQSGIAFPVLRDMQILMDDSGQNTHFLLSILIKHLDHKNVLKQPDMQLDIVQVATALTQLTRVQASVAMVSAVSDIMRHLRKSIHYSIDDAKGGNKYTKWNVQFHEAVDECLTELSLKVGDAGLILDVMAGMLEKIPSIPLLARTTISAVYRAAQIIASLPKISYHKKTFPEALFHQLLPAMLHPDHDTRVGAHQIFSVVLVPTSVAPHVDSDMANSKTIVPRTLSRTVSVFSSSAALFDKMKKQADLAELNKGKVPSVIEHKNSQAYSNTNLPGLNADDINKPSVEVNAVPLRMSSHQITLLFSCIWAQSVSPGNMPQNYEAIAHTYCLVLLFSRAKNSYMDALIRSFQLAFSLRNISLNAEGVQRLPPSRRRSLYMLSTSMILFSAKAYDIFPVVTPVKSVLELKVDPFLCLSEDSKLTVSEKGLGHSKIFYGSKEDDSSAVRSLSEIKIKEDQTTSSLASAIVNNLDNLPDLEKSTTREQLLKEFALEDLGSLKGVLFGGNAKDGNKLDKSLDNVASMMSVMDDDLTETGMQHDSRPSIGNQPHVLSADQLMQSILDASHPVGRVSVCHSSDASYRETADQCDALLMGKKQRMNNLINAAAAYNSPYQQPTGRMSIDKQEVVPNDCTAPKDTTPEHVTRPPSGQQPTSFRLPPSSPYDNFLKAAGC